MSRLTRTRSGRRRRPRRTLALLILAVLVVALLMSVAGVAVAAEESTAVFTEGNPNVQTAEGLEAPELDYTFVWWTFILTFGLLVVYYVLILKISYKEFTKIIDAHFGPKREGR